MEDAFALAVLILSATLRVATPLILCALGALFCERAGLIDIGFNDKMLAAAFIFSGALANMPQPWFAALLSLTPRRTRATEAA